MPFLFGPGGPIMDSMTTGSLPLPANACNAHCHVFGPRERFPYAPDAPYVPATDATSLTSQAKARAFPPISPAAASIFDWVRPDTARVAPRFASASAIPRPTPWPAPVTRATLP